MLRCSQSHTKDHIQVAFEVEVVMLYRVFFFFLQYHKLRKIWNYITSVMISNQGIRSTFEVILGILEFHHFSQIFNM